jgi:death-on-curing protein
MKFLSLFEILELHRQIVAQSGGSHGVKDIGALDSALAQPQMTFGQKDLYPTLFDKASALAYSLVINHPFVDGNKRVAHAAMEIFLLLNGYEIQASVDEQEDLFLRLACGNISREYLAEWIADKAVIKTK